MTKRFQKLMVSVAALAAFALGGSVLAQAQSTTPAKPATAQARPAAAAETPGAKDADHVQSGDQTTPDGPAAKAAAEQPGSETADSAGSERSVSESASDGPGGHADPPGAVDHQHQGAE